MAKLLHNFAHFTDQICYVLPSSFLPRFASANSPANVSRSQMLTG